MNHDPELVEDIALTSAAYLITVLPEVLKLPPSDRFDRLASHFEAALAAYRQGLAGWVVPEPSVN